MKLHYKLTLKCYAKAGDGAKLPINRRGLTETNHSTSNWCPTKTTLKNMRYDTEFKESTVSKETWLISQCGHQWRVWATVDSITAKKESSCED